MNSDCHEFDPIFFVAAALDPNTANFLSEADFNIAVREIQSLVRYDEPPKKTASNTSSVLNTTLDQLLGELAAENRTARNQNEIVQAGARSWIRESLDKVRDASSSGIDPLKWWANLMNTSVKQIAIFAIDVLSIPATSAPIERVFSQAGLACAKHRNRTSFNLLNAQLIVYCNIFLEIVE